MTTIRFAAPSLEDLAIALSEGEHSLGRDATMAGYAVVQWPGSDCPWFAPHPENYSAVGIDVCEFRILEVSP